MLVVNPDIRIPLWELDFKIAPESRTVLRWSVNKSRNVPRIVRERFIARFAERIREGGVVVIASSRYRDPSRNVSYCLKRLRRMLLEAAREPRGKKKTRKKKLAKRKRHGRAV